MVLVHQFVKAIDIFLRNPMARRCCSQVLNARKRTTEEGMVHHAQKFRAEQVLISPHTILVEPVICMIEITKPVQKSITTLNISNYAEIHKLRNYSEYTQKNQITHYSHCKACVQQLVQILFTVHDQCIVQNGFQGNRHHFVHQQIKKVAV